MSARVTEERLVSQVQLERLADWSMRKPVIALMGEFSAGKSTLLNLLIGQQVLPTQITATRMPPVWLRYGESPAYRVDRAGNRHPVDLDDRDAIPVDETAYIRLFCKADILQSCDLMDTPGISDPNIRADDWIRTIRYANAVMWCTHAGQAWRESERGAWEALPSRLRETSILLVTRKDKITSELNLRKIARRLERETSDLFNARMFISLTNAIRARAAGDAEAWTESGAEAFSDMLAQIVEGVAVQRSFMMARYVLEGSKPVAPEMADEADGSEPLVTSELDAHDAGATPEFVYQASAPARASDDPFIPVVNLPNHTSERPVFDNRLEPSDAQASPAADPTDLHEDEPTREEPMHLYGFRPYRMSADFESYRLKDPSAYGSVERRRVDLSN
ncbi:MAG: dynamin family protein [Pseudomonadota bacterium]